jgi:hypothetical protein
MRRLALSLAAMAVALPGLAQELPKSPKAAPPEPLPEASCDTGLANAGEWLLGRWVAPQSRWEFTRQAGGLAWTLEQKGSVNGEFGWRDGAEISGVVEKATACTVSLVARDGGDTAFAFNGVLIDGGKIFGFATNKAGRRVRYLLRRER